MCSLTDESKQSADLAASRLSGSLCRIFPLCLVKLYRPVLGGNSCRPVPIIHIQSVSCSVGGITSSCSVTAWRTRNHTQVEFDLPHIMLKNEIIFCNSYLYLLAKKMTLVLKLWCSFDTRKLFLEMARQPSSAWKWHHKTIILHGHFRTSLLACYLHVNTLNTLIRILTSTGILIYWSWLVSILTLVCQLCFILQVPLFCIIS